MTKTDDKTAKAGCIGCLGIIVIIALIAIAATIFSGNNDDDKELTPDEDELTLDGLHAWDAEEACIAKAEQSVQPDTITVHTIAGQKIKEVNDHDIRYLWETTIEPATGGEITGELLCIVTGTNEAPEVELELR